MAKKSTTQITVTVLGDGIDLSYAPTPTVNATAAPSGGPQIETLAAGDNTIAVPAGAIGVTISPGTSVTLFTKGNVADTGLELDAAKSHFLGLPAGATAIILASTAGGTVFLTWA